MWKVDGDLVVPEDTTAHNPLLAVMWARFQEGCRLLFASGAVASPQAISLIRPGMQTCSIHLWWPVKWRARNLICLSGKSLVLSASFESKRYRAGGCVDL